MLKLIRKNLKLIIISTIICSIICGCIIYRKKQQKKVVKKDLDIIQVRDETMDLSQSPQQQPDISALDHNKH